MGLLQWVMFWILAPAAALGLDLTPAETPPEDFPGQQYIDSTGSAASRGGRACARLTPTRAKVGGN